MAFRTFFFVALTPVLSAEQPASPPNILFIFADDVGQEVLECYGGQSYPTPHLNELGAYGNEI
jgi:arylsulfatase A